jgi:hypothetical protein
MKSENFFLSAVFVTSLAIFACLGLIGVVDFEKSNSISEQENRQLASFPHLRSWRRDLPGFPAQFENFYNDHFSLRLVLSRLRNYLDFEILQSSGNSSCALGRQQWLFYALNKLPAAQQNLEAYEEPGLNAAVKVFCARRDVLAAQGIKYILIFAPEKGTIYPELMPPGWSRQTGFSRLEQLQAALAQHHVDYVDARSVLLKARDSDALSQQLYFSNDSHWNRYGAYLVAQQLFRQMHSDFSSVTPIQTSAIKLKNDDHQGDLALLLGLQKFVVDRKSQVAILLQKQAHSVDNSLLPRFESGIVETATEPSAYRTNDLKLPRAFILHDSFMEFLAPYLAEKFSFSEFYLARLLVPEVIFGEKPDVVIDEIAERHLYDRDFENIPSFLRPPEPQANLGESENVGTFQNQWQLLTVKANIFKRSMEIKLHWRAQKDGKLNDRVLVTLLNSKTKEVKGVTEYRQDSFTHSVKAEQEWVDSVPVTFFSNADFDQIGIMVINESGALSCDAPHCDFRVRAIVDFPSAKAMH